MRVVRDFLVAFSVREKITINNDASFTEITQKQGY